LDLTPGETNPERFTQTSRVNFYEKAISENYAITSTRFQHDSELLTKAELFEFDSLLVAEGESSRLIRNLGFDRQLIKYGEAIGIVINLKFSSSKGPETKIQEFVALRMEATWKQGPLGALYNHGIELENIEYMRGTANHFIAATTKIKDLVAFGIVLEERETVRQSLEPQNMNMQKLYEFASLVSGVIGIPKEAPFAQKNGVQAFDFSCRGQCMESYRFLQSIDDTKKQALVLPIGDALQNPYWPQGLGINKGFHSALNAVWSAHLFGTGVDLKIVKEEQEFGFFMMNYYPPHVISNGSGWTADVVSRWDKELFKKRKFDHELRPQTNKAVPQRILDYFEL
jgi:hypothetical protein